MTKKEAKELTLEVWRYLAEHPEISGKKQLPREIHCKIERLKVGCPLCELYWYKGRLGCSGCPLIDCDDGSDYDNWIGANNREDRSRYAQNIVDKVEAWEVNG